MNLKLKEIYRNYLRIYANLGKTEYTESEKEQLVKTLVGIGEGLFGKTDLRYDIKGEGYGISKSSPYITAKTFRGRLESKGYKKLVGVTADSKNSRYQSDFDLLLQPHNFYRLNMGFFWDFDQNYDFETARNIIKTFLSAMNIGGIPQGNIKEIHPFNVFNPAQIKELTPKSAVFSNKIPVGNELKIWECTETEEKRMKL